jgi:hypothetical protein
LLAAGCGGSASSRSAASVESANLRELLAYSVCMRSHGITDFPDPTGNGFVVIPRSVNPDSSQFQAAQNACQHLQPASTPPASAQPNPTLGVRLAQCMRAHGVPNFPDPGGSVTGTPASNSKLDVRSPQFQAAQRTCRSLVGMPAKATS